MSDSSHKSLREIADPKEQGSAPASRNEEQAFSLGAARLPGQFENPEQTKSNVVAILLTLEREFAGWMA